MNCTDNMKTWKTYDNLGIGHICSPVKNCCDTIILTEAGLPPYLREGLCDGKGHVFCAKKVVNASQRNLS